MIYVTYLDLIYLKHTDKYVHSISCSKKQWMGWDPSIVAEDGEHEVIYFNPCDVGVKKMFRLAPIMATTFHGAVPALILTWSSRFDLATDSISDMIIIAEYSKLNIIPSDMITFEIPMIFGDGNSNPQTADWSQLPQGFWVSTPGRSSPWPSSKVTWVNETSQNSTETSDVL